MGGYKTIICCVAAIFLSGCVSVKTHNAALQKIELLTEQNESLIHSNRMKTKWIIRQKIRTKKAEQGQ